MEDEKARSSRNLEEIKLLKAKVQELEDKISKQADAVDDFDRFAY